MVASSLPILATLATGCARRITHEGLPHRKAAPYRIKTGTDGDTAYLLVAVISFRSFMLEISKPIRTSTSLFLSRHLFYMTEVLEYNQA